MTAHKPDIEKAAELHDGKGFPLDKKAILVGGAGYGKSLVADLLAKKTDDDMMELYEKTHPEEFVDCVDITGEKEMTMISGTFDLKKLKTAKVVPLLNATHFYQPVKGTSSGSRYFVLALGPNLRVAGRWNVGGGGHGLALRVEGPGLEAEETKALVVACGLDFKSATHASVHLSSGSDIDIRKAVGALLIGLGEPWLTPMPSPNVIEGI